MTEINWETHISRHKLMESRGWTKKMIDTFLPVPDQTAPNPNYQKGSPMSLYELKRVEEVERSTAFQNEMQKILQRCAKRKKAAEPRLQAAEKVVAQAGIKLAELSEEPTSSGEGDWTPSERALLHWIIVDDLFERMEPTTAHLQEVAAKLGLAEKVGERELKIKAKEFVLKAIADAYPNLSEECAKRLSGKKRGRHHP